MIVVFAQRYDKNACVGTVVAMILPYMAVICVVWTISSAPGTCSEFPLGFEERSRRYPAERRRRWSAGTGLQG